MEGGAVGKAATNFLSLVYLQIVLPFYRPCQIYKRMYHLVSDRKTSQLQAHFPTCDLEECLKPRQLSSFDQTEEERQYNYENKDVMDISN